MIGLVLGKATKQTQDYTPTLFLVCLTSDVAGVGACGIPTFPDLSWSTKSSAFLFALSRATRDILEYSILEL